MLQEKHRVNLANKGDFIIDSKYTFEVGGAKKGYQQIQNIDNSFLACDNLETSIGSKIPLWLFGFLY